MVMIKLIVDLRRKDILFKWADISDNYAVDLMDHLSSLSSFYHQLSIHFLNHLMGLSIFMLNLKLI